MSRTSHLSKNQLQRLEHSLQEQRDDLKRRIQDNEHYGFESSLRDNTGELSTMDNHPADVATEIYERGKDIALLEHSELQLVRIEEALEQLSEGTYGICRTCDNPIPYQRLEAIPETEYCKEHSPQSSVSNRPPIEEELLDPPFGRNSFDERDDETEFDSEDAWQIVESYGTSDTPAMAEGNNIDNYYDLVIEASTELDGFVESYESFVATDIYGQNVTIYRNNQYHEYMDNDPLETEDSFGYGPNKY